MSGSGALDFSDDDLERLLDGIGDGSEPPGTATASELDVLTRKLAAQYVDIIDTIATQAFRSDTRELAIHATAAAANQLGDLARAAADAPLVALAEELVAIAAPAPAGRQRDQRFRSRLARWIERFADALGSEDALRARRIVRYDPDAQPLLRELATMPGIGAQRLRLLYCAGLYDHETLARATADDIVEVTAMPRILAAEIIMRARARSRPEAT